MLLRSPFVHCCRTGQTCSKTPKARISSVRHEFNAHAGLREAANHNRKPYKPEPRSLPVLTVAKWVGVVIAVAVVWSLIA